MDLERQHILILAPHPDDEVVMCAAAVGRAREAGAALSVFYLTTGVPARKQLWPWDRGSHGDRVARRRDEARRAAGLLGVTIAAESDVPTRGLRNSLMQARVRLARMIEDQGITQLWVPAFEGGHQDHDAANCLAATFADRLLVVEYAAYNFLGGQPQSQTFPDPRGTEDLMVLSDVEQVVKKQLLSLYASEAGNLDYVGLDRECRRPLAQHDYGRPPHAGTLWYARHQWVPFPHPRVDGTKPEQIYRDLAVFLAGHRK
ncbi:PIG-L deacetylase family protein [Magnetospira sp. QH-2]|uniref:PIG-L deacetylase family protein n=1 Tax=Magnetospira sp. (strain QH-2) TaxID=1288970 RepID=UPI0003E80EB0|nr:PIG-L family deacetylase [Magnetospira sp. QH-2]CCQ73417.1 Conserved protein of unknown function [Magnetospira sp. QH-2]